MDYRIICPPDIFDFVTQTEGAGYFTQSYLDGDLWWRVIWGWHEHLAVTGAKAAGFEDAFVQPDPLDVLLFLRPWRADDLTHKRDTADFRK